MIQGAIVTSSIAGIIVRAPSVIDADHVACRFIYEEKGVGGIGAVVAGVVVNHHNEVGGSVIVVVLIKIDGDPSVGYGDIAVIHLDRAAVQIDELGEHRLLHRHQVESDVAVGVGTGAMEREGLQVPCRADFAGGVNLFRKRIFVYGKTARDNVTLFSEKEVAAAQTGSGEADTVRIAGGAVFTMGGDINGVRGAGSQSAQHKVVAHYSSNAGQGGVSA